MIYGCWIFIDMVHEAITIIFYYQNYYLAEDIKII